MLNENPTPTALTNYTHICSLFFTTETVKVRDQIYFGQKHQQFMIEMFNILSGEYYINKFNFLAHNESTIVWTNVQIDTNHIRPKLYHGGL